jgi:hypothetical protein
VITNLENSDLDTVTCIVELSIEFFSAIVKPWLHLDQRRTDDHKRSGIDNDVAADIRRAEPPNSSLVDQRYRTLELISLGIPDLWPRCVAIVHG